MAKGGNEKQLSDIIEDMPVVGGKIKHVRFFYDLTKILGRYRDTLRWRFRNHNYILALFQTLHVDFIHRSRELSLNMSKWSDYKKTTQYAEQVCTLAKDVIQSVLNTKKPVLHCCLKVYIRYHNSDKVATWARSREYDNRPPEMGPKNSHAVEKNTVWCALMGKNDGITSWESPYRCFCSNDLNKYEKLFQCSRTNWKNYYRSTLVFPLFYYDNPVDPSIEYMGFLAFDSSFPNIFSGMPEIFEYSGDEPDDWENYHDHLGKTLPFHVGAIMADILSMFLRPVYKAYEAGKKC